MVLFPLRIRQLGPSLLDTCKCNFGVSGLKLVRFSCNADQEQFSSPVNMDPFLLLKTLDFPPLTWVVQGFDMDLSDRTPMDHLYRYLEAHAHTGDRTLDTLFTQGISCLTMRTPTDLNKLREQVGMYPVFLVVFLVSASLDFYVVLLTIILQVSQIMVWPKIVCNHQ